MVSLLRRNLHVQTPRCKWHRRVKYVFSVVFQRCLSSWKRQAVMWMIMVIQIFFVFFILIFMNMLTQRCHWHCWVKLRGVVGTVESDLPRNIFKILNYCTKNVRPLWILDPNEFESLKKKHCRKCCETASFNWSINLYRNFSVSLNPLS